MSSVDPTAAYRKQQGMAKVTQSYDPVVVGWVVRAAKATGADPAALLATAIQESGARRGAVGDGGTSFGPWQMHEGGALGSHNAAWANSYATALNRAQEFARLQVHGGVGAAAVQRPADRSLYAQGVNAHLEQAKAILAHYGLKMPADTPAATTPAKTPVTAAPVIQGSNLLASLLGEDQTGYVSPLQNLINQNANLAHITPVTLPNQPMIQPTLAAPTVDPTKPAPKLDLPGAKTTPTPVTGGSKKIAYFEGTPVQAWMLPALTYARQRGWKGKLTSGVRTTALQAQLYQKYLHGGNIAAKPGTSNHEITGGGAVDVTDPSQLNAILNGFKGKRPIWAMTVGLNDHPHFSSNGH